jgi:thymidylate synthase (FAD)
MKLIKPYFEIIEQKSSIEDLYKHIELCGRNAYKSEDKITEDSAKAFVDKICKAKHGSVLEHGTVYLKAKTELINMYIHPEDGDYEEYNILSKYEDNKYSNVFNDGEYLYVTTNFRVLKENDWLNDIQYICEPTEFHEKRVSVRFVCSRAISHELVRHRVFTFTQESQRYCNYSKDKFGNDVTFIKPLWVHTEREEFYGHILTNTIDYSDTELRYMMSLKESENAYLDLLYFDYKPEEAREVLPNSTKTDIIMTGFVSDWKHFFELRTAENAHPEMRRLAIPLQDEFIKKGYLK